MGKKGLSIQGLVKELEKLGIATVLRENAEGLIYGITFVDHRTKCVFNGSALGKRYSAKAIQERCIEDATDKQKIRVRQMEKPALPDQANRRDPALNPERISGQKQHQAFTTPLPDIGKALDELVQPEQTADYLPYHLKKKKRKHLSHNQ